MIVRYRAWGTFATVVVAQALTGGSGLAKEVSQFTCTVCFMSSRSGRHW